METRKKVAIIAIVAVVIGVVIYILMRSRPAVAPPAPPVPPDEPKPPPGVRQQLLAYYRDSFGTAGVYDTPSYLAIIDDHRDSVTPPGFGYPPTEQERDTVGEYWKQR